MALLFFTFLTFIFRDITVDEIILDLAKAINVRAFEVYRYEKHNPWLIIS